MEDPVKKRASFLINTAYYLVAVLIAYVLIKYVASLFMPFIIAFCIVSIIHPLVKKITAILKIKHEIIAVIVMAGVYALLGYGMIVLIIKLFAFLGSWLSDLPAYYESTLAPTLTNIGNIISRTLYDMPFLDDIDFSSFYLDIIGAVQSFIISFSQTGISFVTSVSARVPSFFIAFTFTIMLSFFISLQYKSVLRFINAQIPPKGKTLLMDLKFIFTDTVSKYIRAIGKIMVITFFELCIGFVILGVGNPIGVAAGISLFDALPVFGTGGIMIPWIILELIQANYSLSLGILILYAIITVIRNIIEPKIVGDQLGMNPIVSLIVIYIGFRVFGVFGMIFMPIVAQVILALHNNGNIKLYKPILDDDIKN